VNEAAIEAFAVGHEANARAKVEIVHRRTEEIAALADEGRLDAETAGIIADNIQEHASEIVTEVAATKDESADQGAEDVVSEELAVAVGESAAALNEALVELAPEPPAEARVMMMAVVADEAPATTTDEAANQDADTTAETGETAPGEDSPISAEEASEIGEVTAELSILSQTLDAIGEEPATTTEAVDLELNLEGPESE
jgi:hypothetical protein